MSLYVNLGLVQQKHTALRFVALTQGLRPLHLKELVEDLERAIASREVRLKSCPQPLFNSLSGSAEAYAKAEGKSSRTTMVTWRGVNPAWCKRKFGNVLEVPGDRHPR